MSKRVFKAQASSSRAASGAGFGAGGFGSATSISVLSYLTEPPDLSSISDSNVIVSFKNLSKKDSTTKAKALEDLRTYVQAHPFESDGGVEDFIIEAWVHFYPRVSIDNSRRVRELSHNLQFDIASSVQKRISKFLSKLVASWIAGTFDKDRGVARAAENGLNAVFDSAEKISKLWKAFSTQIIDYARQAINESPETLSDERTVNLDDMQAKYYRVVNSGMSMIMNLLESTDEGMNTKHKDTYEECLAGNKKLWGLVASNDPSVRKTASQLLILCLQTCPAVIEDHLGLMSDVFIAKGFRSPQSTTAYHFLHALGRLTQRYPQIWTSSYKGKKAPLLLLNNFVEKGSQGSQGFWEMMTLLVPILPRDIIAPNVDDSLSFLVALRKGMSNREEPRQNSSVAWSTYIDTINIFSERYSATEEDLVKLFSQSIFPLFEKYLRSTLETDGWSAKMDIATLVAAYKACTSIQGSSFTLAQKFKGEWERLGSEFCTRISTSQPEQSKLYSSSQTELVQISHRWFELLREVLTVEDGDKSKNYIVIESNNVLLTSLSTMVNRNGKPYSAAATVESAMQFVPEIFELLPTVLTALKSFFADNFVELFSSPSMKYLVSMLNLLRSVPRQEELFERVWQSTIEDVLANSPEEQVSKLVNALISNEAVVNLSQASSKLQSFIFQSAAKFLATKDADSWIIFETAVIFKSATEKTLLDIYHEAASGLHPDAPYLESALKVLELISDRAPAVLSNQTSVELMTNLIAATAISDSVSALRARKVKAIVETSSAGTGTYGDLRGSLILQTIHGNLETAGPQSLSVSTLVTQALDFVKSTNDPLERAAVFPNLERWAEALLPFVNQTPSSSLATMRPFAGAVYLVDQLSTQSDFPKDVNGHSVAARMAMYTSRLVHLLNLIEDSTQLLERGILLQLLMTYEVLSVQLDTLHHRGLFDLQRNLAAVVEIEKCMGLSRGIFGKIAEESQGWRDDAPDNEELVVGRYSNLIRHVIQELIELSGTNSPSSYYSAQALARLLQLLTTCHSWKTHGSEQWLTNLDILKSSTSNVLGAAAVLIGLADCLRSSKITSNLCNRLISDLAGAAAGSKKTLSLLVLSNACLAVYEGKLPVAQNRLVFAVKQILSWTTDLPDTDPKLTSEACYTLQLLLPAIGGVYGSYWESSLDFCASIWTSTKPGHRDELGRYDDELDGALLAMMGMSLKLFSTLQNMNGLDNDDLQEALENFKEQESNGLINILKLPRRIETQPLQYVDELLSRLVAELPLTFIPDLSELYPLMASDFRLVQIAAFSVLEKALPKEQQQLSVDVVLDQKDATLPLELVSLLMDAPQIGKFTDELLDTFPSSIRGYLLSWNLVYQSLAAASLKVRGDYSDHLKSENCITPLLDFTFDILGHSTGDSLDLEKAKIDPTWIRKYDMSEAKGYSNSRDMEWMLVNLYYYALKYTPNLVKAWRLECNARQTRIQVEAWTEKFFSPLIIQDILDDVSTWAENQEVASDENELDVKVSKSAREVTASYEIDDMSATIRIILPKSYPFEGAKATGINRVAAKSEKVWNGWMLAIQGAIQFSNGSIIDGLLVFRKNIINALKGQTECAICYSIISSDKKLPDKKCQTCSHLFHGSCLYQWFNTGNQSTCPLCRNQFSFATPSKRG